MLTLKARANEAVIRYTDGIFVNETPESGVEQLQNLEGQTACVQREPKTSLQQGPSTETYCLPRLLYGCEIWPIESVDMHELDVIWNNGFRHLSLIAAGDVTV